MVEATNVRAAPGIASMDELLPGIFHWKAFHEGIGMEVGSHCVRLHGEITLIDPMEPPEGLEWFRDAPPTRILLTNRHHWRHSGRFVEAFGCQVRCHRAGVHEFDDGREVEPFDFGEEVAPGIRALEVGAICDEDTALHVRSGEGILAFADALIRYRGALGFVPDSLIGADPERVKREMRRSLASLLDADFDHLLFAHGEPLVGGGKSALRRFLERGGTG